MDGLPETLVNRSQKHVLILFPTGSNRPDRSGPTSGGSMVQTVAENLVSLMVSVGIQRIYGIVGDSANALIDAIHHTDGKIAFINVRNEEAGAFAAGADADISGSISAVIGSCGPGSLHLVNGLYDCNRNSASVFAIATHIPQSEIGSRFFQETRPDWIFADCTKYLGYATTSKQMPRIAELAIQAAFLERGVGMVILPGDVSRETIEKPLLPHPIARTQPISLPKKDDLVALAELIDRSKKIVIYGGAGCRNGRGEVLELSRKIQAPIAYAYRGKDVLEADNPNGIGMTGHLGWGAAAQAFRECDLLLMLGTDFPFHSYYPKQSTIVQIDDTPSQLGRRAMVNMALTGDIRTTVEALLPMLAQKKDTSFLDSMLSLNSDILRLMMAAPGKEQDSRLLSPERVTRTIDEMADDNAIYTVDTGMCNIWSARYLRMKKDQRMLASYNHGSMANALPQAIGAALSDPGRQVIALCGDGGLTMLMGELLTAVEQNLPVKLMVFNNSSRAMVRQEMIDSGLNAWGTEVNNPDFGAVARTIGLYGERVEKTGDIRDAITRAFDYPGPALIDFVTDPATVPVSVEDIMKRLDKMNVSGESSSQPSGN